MKRLFGFLMLLALLTPMVGCEAEGRVDADDDDGAKLKVDVDD